MKEENDMKKSNIIRELNVNDKLRNQDFIRLY